MLELTREVSNLTESGLPAIESGSDFRPVGRLLSMGGMVGIAEF